MSLQTERAPALTDAQSEPTRAETSSVQLPGGVNFIATLRDIRPIVETAAIGIAGALWAIAGYR